MRVLDLFSGIGGFSLAFERHGFRTVAFSEIEKFPCRVLAHHWPDVPNVGDIRRTHGRNIHTDIITAGFPCTDISIAGKMRGLAGAQSGLFTEIIRIVEEMEADGHGPQFLLLENVPNILSINRGRDHATILGALIGATVAVPADGWRRAGVASGPSGVATWRVLDARFFGVPQRRRRWFCLVERHPRTVRGPQILFEPNGVPGHSAPRQGAEQDTARPLGNGTGSRGWRDDLDHSTYVIKGAAIGRHPAAGPQRGEVAKDACYALNTTEVHAVCATLGASGAGTDRPSGNANGHDFLVPVARHLATGTNGQRYDLETETFVPVSIHQNQRGECTLSPTVALNGGGGTPGQGYPAVIRPRAFNWQSGGSKARIGYSDMPSALQANQVSAVQQALGIRRLTPTECERLQHFPDGWTALSGASDGGRYRALGNAVCVAVVEWIAERMAKALS